MTALLILLVIVLLIANIFLFVRYVDYRGKLKFKGVFGSWPIRQVSIDQIDPVFKINEFGPTLDTEVKFIGRGSLRVPGGTSDVEAWILSVFAKKSKNIFELGTCTGKTSYLMAVNAPADATVTTLTLGPDQLAAYDKDNADSSGAIKDALDESVFNNFLYTGTPEERKIKQLFNDSKLFDEKPFYGSMDLIFIDGSHAFSYIMNDSEKALKMVAPNGVILWHDYRGPHLNKDVYKAMNQLSKRIPLVHIRDTSLIMYRHQKNSN